jgi:molybdenum cofactor synthesis domain-containing protein
MGDDISSKSAAALVVGNELLSGKVQDENVVALASTLRRLGISLRRVVMVLDEIDTIAAEVRRLSREHDFVFTSGGVGPTHDDLTIEAVARAFNLSVVSSPSLEAMLRAHYRERCTEGHLRMALIPEGAVLAVSREVTWPTIIVQNVWLLPGVPEIFRMKLAVVRERLAGGVPFLSRAVYTKMDEGHLKPLLDAVVAAHREVEVGSYPAWSDPSYRTKLTFDGRDAAAVTAALEAFVALLPAGEPQRVE